MKLKFITTTLLLLVLIGCSTSKNNPEFIKNVTGRYLYNSDEIVEVYFENTELHLKWRGANKIKPLKVDENTFFVKEMNEKIQFLKNPTTNVLYICLVPKNETDSLVYNFKKLNESEKIPSEYLVNNEFDKALEAYKSIQQKDSLDSAINEGDINSLGYKELRKKNYTNAINIFKINAALYPESANVYDSLGEAYMKNSDTINAIKNYKKSLTLDSGNKRAKRQLNKLEKKEAEQ
jgi:hypothetical protein